MRGMQDARLRLPPYAGPQDRSPLDRTPTGLRGGGGSAPRTGGAPGDRPRPRRVPASGPRSGRARSDTMLEMRRDNIVLVGFMGAGKSVCGRLLARRLGRCFVETDDMITGREGRSIPEIFAARGEVWFRELEGLVLEDLKLKSGDVIATGGGLPCR